MLLIINGWFITDGDGKRVLDAALRTPPEAGWELVAQDWAVSYDGELRFSRTIYRMPEGANPDAFRVALGENIEVRLPEVPGGFMNVVAFPETAQEFMDGVPGEQLFPPPPLPQGLEELLAGIG